LDTDGDGIGDEDDNCPSVHNENQLDANSNNVGDACEGLLANGVKNLARWWVIQISMGDNNITWGEGPATLNNDDVSVAINLILDDGTSAQITFVRTDHGLLRGTSTIGEEEENIIDIRNDVLRNRLYGAIGGKEISMYPAQAFEQGDVGVYEREKDGVQFILATDLGFSGNRVLLSALAPDGTWPEDGRYNLENNPDIVRVEGWEGTATRFSEGNMVYLCSNDSNYQFDHCDVLNRLSTQSVLNGAWLATDNYMYNWPGTHSPVTEWLLAVIVDHDNTLYVHERNEGLYGNADSGLDRALRASRDSTGIYRDTDHGGYSSWYDWVGYINEDKARIVGRWDYPNGGAFWSYHHSFTRTIEPPSDYLTGDASSLSINWMDFAFGLEAVVGNAQMVQDGTHLSIIDHSIDGGVYQVDAEWTGYQYEGHWWLIENPEVGGFWRGQLLCHGMVLHGTWDHGEYSFWLAPISDNSTGEMIGVQENTMTVSPDPNLPDMIIGKRIDGGSVTIHRDLDQITGLTLITADNKTYRIHLDDRMRPVRIEDSANAIETIIRYSEDSSSATVTVDDNGFTTQETEVLDLSDSQILADLSAMEQQTGEDFSGVRNYILDNPGWFGSLARGQIDAPNAFLPPIETSFLRSNMKNGDEDYLTNRTSIFLQVLVAVATWFATTGGMYSVAITSKIALTAMSAFCALTILTFVGAFAFMFVLIMTLEGNVCDPCRLDCFWNCP